MTTRIHRLHDDALANTSYLVEVDDARAIVIDPPRDVDAHLALAKSLGVTIAATIETHLHADYVSGSTELVTHGAEAIVPRDAAVKWSHRDVDDGERIRWGRVSLRALATPGHTPEHTAYVLEVADTPQSVFTGGSLILGGAARTDLLGADRTRDLARAQFHSLQRLAELPDALAVHPTHGAGSFCLAAAAAVTNPTIGSERRSNPLLAIDDEDAFVEALVAGFGTFPTYYGHLQELNRRGPAPIPAIREAPALTPAATMAAVERGAWLIDARPIHDWAAFHPVRAISNTLRPAFASWLGWVVPFGARTVFLVEDDQRDEAVRLAHRIGYDDLSYIEGGMKAWHDSGLPVASIEEIDAREARARQRAGVLLLDVRQDAEVHTLRIPGAEHVELGEIIAGATPSATEVITFCGHGERSATAASLLTRRAVRAANLVGGTAAWVEAGLPVER